MIPLIIEFDCIVWECEGTCFAFELNCHGESTVTYETLLCEVKDQVAR